MDASDTIRKRRAQKIFVDIKNANITTQGNNNCGTCSEKNPVSGTACTLNFNSYEEKRLYVEGKNACNSCACPN